MNYDHSDLIARIREGVANTYSVTNLAPWIEKYTYLDGRRFSFKDHEFQKPIIEDTAKTSIVIKCAQVGLSEILYRYAVAACITQDDFTVIYTFPSATDAETNNRTRIDPMIEGSPEVLRMVNPNMNNSTVKQFGRNSFLFFKGTFSSTAGISTPANCLVHDEYDKSDITTTSVYVSRLQHKPHKIRKIFSTPTTEGYGVSKEAETANRYKHLAKCNHCSHVFLPDYYNHVVVPGWDSSLEEITRDNLHRTSWRDAYLACPSCGKDPDLHYSRLEFVCENPSEAHDANAWYVSPFSAPNIISVPYLVQSSTKYKRISEFKNQALGLTAEEANESITLADLDKNLQTSLMSSDLHVMGADMGLTCHICIGRVASSGEILLVHREKVHYTQFEVRSRELAAEYRVFMAVMDSQPYTDLVTRVSRARPNWWGAIFVTSKNPSAFTLQEDEEDVQEGKMAMRLVKVNRNVALDELLGVIKEGKLVIQRQDDHDEFKAHMMSLKRIQKFTKEGELVYVWEKTGDENDHYHFALLYMKLACDMRGTAGGTGAVAAGVSLVQKIKRSRA
jgi:hypothetical protein